VGRGQSISFSNINTSNGLSENNVQSVAIDKKGFLWIGTIDGLNLYDGYSVTVFKKETQPAMASNNVIHMTCDSRNRIWLGTHEGITWLDENRSFHRVILNDTASRFACRTVMDTKKYGPVLYTSLGQYYYDNSKKKWEQFNWMPATLEYRHFHDAEPFDENRIIYATDSLVMIVDYATQQIIYQQPFANVTSLCRYSDHEVAIGLGQGEVLIADINSNTVVKQFEITSELNKKKVNASITEIRPAANGSLLIGTYFAGLMIIDRNGNIARYTHDPINPNSIAANMLWRVLGGTNGDVIVGTTTAGISVFNIYNQQAGYTRVFSDGQGNFYDTYIADVEEGSNGVLWLGALERLIRWDKNNNQVKFYYYYSPPGWKGPQSLELRSVCLDRLGRVWVSALGDGISILQESTGQFRKIPRDTSLGPAVKSNYVFDLYPARDGYVWVGSNAGLYRINPTTLDIDAFANDSLLKQVSGMRVCDFLEDGLGNMWISTFRGLYCYNKEKRKLDHYTTQEGLASNQCYNLLLDQSGNLYVGTVQGFSVVSNGKIRNYGRANGLKYDYCEGLVQGQDGKIWLANTKCIIRFDPATGAMQYFDENSGLSNEGFRFGAFKASQSGELFWGSRKGINYFYPGQLVNHPADIVLSIYQAETTDTTFNFGMDNTIALRYTNNSVVFRFAAINLKGSRNIQYQYMLEGYDKDWQNGMDIRQARYTALPAGHYNFKLRASLDRVNWVDSPAVVHVRVIPPLWQQWWFIGALLVIVTGVIYWVIANRNQKIDEQREEIEREQAINYFASSLSDQQTEEAILWDVAKNCIGRLHFEDCVIYLLDEEQGLLIQKAAHGRKSPREFEIKKPLAIELGKGIVGSVALSGKPEIVNDTSKDPRYIVDEEKRLSEITVPIINDGRVLGVIDCEHSKKSFFTQKQLSILVTIASLCANKIVRVRAEEEKREAQNILMRTQQKMTEVEMQALRAQMNPHFIFNCLNSINRYIVKSDQTTASLYLTKFAKLIRLILDNSNSKNVILSQELEALKLYIEMEALRFDKKFSYEIKVEGNLGADTVEVPPLIIQPYVENAIWHGLLHKEENGHLSVRVSQNGGSMLYCVIEDNGVGRERAKELKSKSATSRKSLGMQLTQNRLSLLNKHAELNASVEIVDLKDENGTAAGTRVILKIPM
jgi:ligand-binding sensor domain-containing protein/putative methionine-R-sulfoxide reductase with GAF domain